MSGTDVSPTRYERLALEMLAVEAGDVADVKETMRRIIASAPQGADIAFLLSRALAHVGDRAPIGPERQLVNWELGSAQLDHDFLPAGPANERSPSKWWLCAAVPPLGMAAMFWWMGYLALQTPDDRAGAVGMAATLMFVISVAFLGAALIGVETLFLLRWQAPRPIALASSLVRPPGWYVDP